MNGIFFLSNLNIIPKTGKKDLSFKKSWRPISIGTSENWVLEKVLVNRVLPYLQTHDCQFGYKKDHNTSHAIEIIRVIERDYDVHACMLDASSAFDMLSWRRIKSQFIKRGISNCYIKILMLQLFSNKISVCGTIVFYSRRGVKQGGVLSGIIFAACYDDLVDMLRCVGAGVLIKTLGENLTLVFVIIYADDVILFAKSPFGLRRLIECTLQFADIFDDISFNPSKSFILRLGPHRREPVSVCGIPTSSCQQYLGVEIGKSADPQKQAASKLYCNTNLLLVQNRELKMCNSYVKNSVISSYGNVYCIENLTTVSSKVRNAHRYLTKAVYTDWIFYADLDGPNIRSRTLYVTNGLDSLEVIHRRRRNNFLIRSASHSNSLIANIIGNLPRITA